MRLHYLLPLAALLACLETPPSVPYEPALTLDGLRAMPWDPGPVCERVWPQWRLAVVDDAGYSRWCERQAPDAGGPFPYAGGCYLWLDAPYAVVHESAPAEMIEHEVRHGAAHCHSRGLGRGEAVPHMDRGHDVYPWLWD